MNARRLLLSGIILILAAFVVSSMLEKAKPTLTIKEFHFSGCQARVIGEVHHYGRRIAWAAAPRRDSMVPPEKRDGSVKPVPSVQAVYADERGKKVNTHRGLHFFDHNYSSRTVLDVYSTGFVGAAEMHSGPFDETVFFPRDWSGGEVVFAARYREMDPSLIHRLREKMGRVPWLRNLVKAPAIPTNPGTLIFSEPVTVPEVDPDSHIDIIETPEEMLNMQGPDGSISS